MPDICQFVQTYANTSFAELPFGTLDSLALSQVCYMPFEGLLEGDARATLGEAWAFLRGRYPNGMDDPFQQKRYLLTQSCADTARYADVALHGYVNHIDPRQVTQFSATTFDVPTGERCVAYRGTDLTLAGWKEDLNMSFMIVPAQTMATAYLEKAAEDWSGPLYVNGHSKGGNLAMFAAARANPQTQERLTAVHTFDGQGLDEETFRSPGYERVTERIASFVPQGSLVGLLLCYHPEYTVVRSSAAGLLQHDATTWQVEGNCFATAPELDWTSRVTHEAIEAWLLKLDKDDRRLLVDTISRIVGATQADTVDQIMANWRENGEKMLTALRELDAPTKKTVRSFLRILFTLGANNAMRSLLPGLFRSVFGTGQQPAKPDGATQPGKSAAEAR